MRDSVVPPAPLQPAEADRLAPASAAPMMPAMTPGARRQGIRNAFDRAAAHYDEAAHIQREICSRLSAFAMALALEPLRPGRRLPEPARSQPRGQAACSEVA